MTDLYINPTRSPYSLRARNLRQHAPQPFAAHFRAYDEALSARKNFHIWESINLQFRADFFNAFNRTNFETIFTGTNNPQIPRSGFGQIGTQGNLPRSIQFALKVLF